MNDKPRTLNVELEPNGACHIEVEGVYSVLDIMELIASGISGLTSDLCNNEDLVQTKGLTDKTYLERYSEILSYLTSAIHSIALFQTPGEFDTYSGDSPWRILDDTSESFDAQSPKTGFCVGDFECMLEMSEQEIDDDIE